MYTEFLTKIPDAATYEKLSEEKISEMEKEFCCTLSLRWRNDHV